MIDGGPHAAPLPLLGRIAPRHEVGEGAEGEVASPRPRDQLIVDSQTFVVQGEPERRDPDWLVWSLDISPDFPFDLGRG